jgi:hypothetical protein
LEGSEVLTPSGGRHLYYRTEGADVQTNASVLFKGLDIRGSGGYVVGPGSMTATGTYRGDISKIPMAPDALLAILPEKQTFVTVEADAGSGDKPAEPSINEQRQLADQIARLEALPREWTEGAGWHATVYRACCHLSRMVNSAHYALTVDGALAILTAATPFYPEWPVARLHEQWNSARLSTAGQAAEPPTDKHPHLPPIVEVIHFLPELTPGSQESFTSLVFNAPEGAPETWWRARRTLLVECLRAGRPIEEAASAAWHSVAGSPLRENEAAGLDELWKEAEKARAAVAGETGEGVEALPDAERPSLALVANRISLMSDAERAIGQQPWWGTEYLDWAESRVSMMNLPYHRMNRWTILSAVFSDIGFLPDPARPIGLNLFVNVLGKSTTGKSESVWLMNSVLKACFPKDDAVGIGGNASPNALLERLIIRDGKPSLFITDEAHGLFQQMQGENSWMSGLKELLAALYEGEVPVILRTGKKDVSGVNASTHFLMHLMGTIAGMTKALDEAMWESGLLPRFIWAIGDELEVTPESYEARQVEGYSATAYDEMPKQWAAQFSAKKMQVRHGHAGQAQIPILHSPEALARQTELQRKLGTIAKGHRQEELLKPTMIRFGINVRKCAILVALVNGRRVVTLDDELIAIEAAEEWINNIFLMVETTTATGFSRSVDGVEKIIAAGKNQQIRIERLYARLKEPVRFVDEWINQLVKEGRIEKSEVKGEYGAYVLKIKSAPAAQTEMRIAA